jgi:hypothetical protein
VMDVQHKWSAFLAMMMIRVVPIAVHPRATGHVLSHHSASSEPRILPKDADGEHRRLLDT